MSSISTRLRTIHILLILCLTALPAAAQFADLEPNDTCQAAQVLGMVDFPLSITGGLDSMPGEPEIDFFRLVGLPGAAVTIDLQGASSGSGTLADPYLGALDSACNVLALDDDGGYIVESRIRLVVPSDGGLVVAATSCCDGTLEGNGGTRGSYLLTIDYDHIVSSIRARLIDAETGEPLVGWWPTHGRAELWRCVGEACDQWLWTEYADGDGVVRFTHDHSSNPLEPGTFQLRAYAEGYEPSWSPVFEAVEGEDLDLGDTALHRYATIGSISGRVVDSIDGQPLSGQGPPYAWLTLFRCDDSGCWDMKGSIPADEDGRFAFNRNNTWSPLIVGSYRLDVSAVQYRATELLVEDVVEDEDRIVGDVPLMPFPIQFGEVRPCVNIPPDGGRCVFSVQVRAGSRRRFDGGAWSIVTADGIGSFVGSTVFQAGSTPASVPIVERLKLSPGETAWLEFQFDVPGNVAGGAWICPTVWVGRQPEPYFQTVAQNPVFCLSKEWDGYTQVPDKLIRLRERQERRAPAQ
jgi:hypothetical protein